MIVLLVVCSWLVVGSLVALLMGAAIKRGNRPVDPPTPPAPKVSPLVEPLTVVGDLLCILEHENLHAAEEEMDPFVSARLLEYAARVQVAQQVVAELRDVKAGATL